MIPYVSWYLQTYCLPYCPAQLRHGFRFHFRVLPEPSCVAWQLGAAATAGHNGPVMCDAAAVMLLVTSPPPIHTHQHRDKSDRFHKMRTLTLVSHHDHVQCLHELICYRWLRTRRKKTFYYSLVKEKNSFSGLKENLIKSLFSIINEL